MDVYRQETKVRLTQAEFKARGGEGAVYVSGDMAYKVYADPAKMIPVAKIKELSALDLPGIVRPQDVLLDAARIPIGYTMQNVPDSFVLCQAFTPAFRQRLGLTPEKVLHLVRQLQDGVAYVHSRSILIVDLNEMNFLVDPAFGQVYFIDVDSYQTPHFPATALMDSVRDRHAAAAWNTGTDWFSFAVVSFQMFVGIHPYKGKHPSVKTLDERMQQNLSVFHPDVSLPGVCPPLSVIPQAYRNWYKAVLEQGERTAPPNSIGAAVRLHPIPVPNLAGGGPFVISRWRGFAGTIISFTHGFTVTTEGVYFGEQRRADTKTGVVGLTPQSRSGVLASLESGRVRLFDLTRQVDLPLSLTAEQIMASGGRVYAKQGGSLLEVSFVETAAQVWASAKVVGAVLEQATQLFEGVALQNLLGAWYASVLPERGHCYQVRLPELDGQIINAKFDGGVLMVVAARLGKFQKLVFRFAGDYSAYDVRVIPDLATYGVNFVVLDSGLCLHLSDDGDLEIFPAKQGTSAQKVITDPALGGDCLLLQDGSAALSARGNALYRLAMK